MAKPLLRGDSMHNRPAAFIANLEDGSSTVSLPAGEAPVHMGAAHWIKLSASADGSFTISNSRTGLAKSYAPRN